MEGRRRGWSQGGSRPQACQVNVFAGSVAQCRSQGQRVFVIASSSESLGWWFNETWSWVHTHQGTLGSISQDQQECAVVCMQCARCDWTCQLSRIPKRLENNLMLVQGLECREMGEGISEVKMGKIVQQNFGEGRVEENFGLEP